MKEQRCKNQGTSGLYRCLLLNLKMPKCQKCQTYQKCQKCETKDAKATLVMPAFGSEDVKMASQDITEAKETSEISYDTKFWNQ